jgi:hypothetical protein
MSDLFLRYAHRTLAALYLLAWAVIATAQIGNTSTTTLSWAGAWASVLTLAVAMWLGWQAKGEASHE